MTQPSRVVFDFFEAQEPHNRLEEKECEKEPCEDESCKHELLEYMVKCEQVTRTTLVTDLRPKETREPNRILAVIDDEKLQRSYKQETYMLKMNKKRS